MIDGADKIENVYSIDVTHQISREITVESPPVSSTKSFKAIYQSFKRFNHRWR